VTKYAELALNDIMEGNIGPPDLLEDGDEEEDDEDEDDDDDDEEDDQDEEDDDEEQEEQSDNEDQEETGSNNSQDSISAPEPNQDSDIENNTSTIESTPKSTTKSTPPSQSLKRRYDLDIKCSSHLKNISLFTSHKVLSENANFKNLGEIDEIYGMREEMVVRNVKGEVYVVTPNLSDSTFKVKNVDLDGYSVDFMAASDCLTVLLSISESTKSHFKIIPSKHIQTNSYKSTQVTRIHKQNQTHPHKCKQIHAISYSVIEGYTICINFYRCIRIHRESRKTSTFIQIQSNPYKVT